MEEKYRYTFKDNDGKFPLNAEEKVRWVTSRDEAVKEAYLNDCDVLVTMDEAGVILKEEKLLLKG